jgi:DNA-binding MurR/RpiR family transcriptional regulator
VLFAIATVYTGIDTGYIVKMARQKDVKTICLTGYGTSLPAREAEIALIAPIQSPTGIVSYEIVLMLISLIWAALSALRPDKVAEAFTQTFDNLGELRKLRAETLPYDVLM